MLYVWTNGYLGKKNEKIAHEAMAFIQGTGLELVIRLYKLGLNADELREKFFKTFHIKSI